MHQQTTQRGIAKILDTTTENAIKAILREDAIKRLELPPPRTPKEAARRTARYAPRPSSHVRRTDLIEGVHDLLSLPPDHVGSIYDAGAIAEMRAELDLELSRIEALARQTATNAEWRHELAAY